jgi:hypothetical protein
MVSSVMSLNYVEITVAQFADKFAIDGTCLSEVALQVDSFAIYQARISWEKNRLEVGRFATCGSPR